jgi:predicted transcriptional regulator
MRAQPPRRASDTRWMKVGSSAPSRPLPKASHAQDQAGPRRSFLEVLEEGRRERPAVSAAGAPRAPAAPRIEAPSSARAPTSSTSVGRGLAQVLDRAAAGEARLDAILEAAARGKTFTAGELLAMQATVFRYSQTIEVLSRATDRLVGAVKQTLGTPV